MYEVTKQQHGNALWFILIAVALFGTLTIILSRNGSSVNQSANIEKTRIKANALLRYTKSVENATQQMMLNGISENDLDFVAIGADHDNPNCTSADCEVFNIKGGGIEFQSPSDILDDPSYTGNWHVSSGNRVYLMGCDDANNSCTELVLLAEDIPLSVCLQINAVQNITNPGGDAPQQSEVLHGAAYTGTFSALVNGWMFGGQNAANESPEVRGKNAGCIFEFGGGQNKYYFYQVLIAR